MKKTVWGETLDPNRVLQEYPRPQLRRESYINLNGYWDFSMEGVTREPSYGERILVPFSPECELSGIGRSKQPGERLYYRRSFILPEGFLQDRLLLHFGAVDCKAAVYVNGKEAGEHQGGYWPFCLDITELYQGGENRLEVWVEDEAAENYLYAYGKQSTRPGGIWYTAQSGIWQTVWLESVPRQYIRSLTMTPLCQEGCLQLTVHTREMLPCRVYFQGLSFKARSNIPVKIPVENVQLWSPEDPYLYGIAIEAGEDRVESYFAMREIGIGKDSKGRTAPLLNGKPIFFHGILDQGYWSDGLYTAPHDEALVCDIQTMKALGFNTLRKHIKIEPLRWYYHCDRLGMLVWQDMVSGGGPYRPEVITLPVAGFPHRGDKSYRAFGRASKKSRQHYRQELRDTVELLYNCPSLVLWVPFNEGWGQFDALQAVEAIRKLDSHRLIDHASGWHDQGGGDFYSRHVYFRPFRLKQDKKGERILSLSEFGGYTLPMEGHLYSEDRVFSYRKIKSPQALEKALTALYEKQIVPAKKRGLYGSIYTQLSDVETEINGLLTYDRRVLKVSKECMEHIAELLLK